MFGGVGVQRLAQQVEIEREVQETSQGLLAVGVRRFDALEDDQMRIGRAAEVGLDRKSVV